MERVIGWGWEVLYPDLPQPSSYSQTVGSGFEVTVRVRKPWAGSSWGKNDENIRFSVMAQTFIESFFPLHIICRDNLDHFSVSFLLLRGSSFIKSTIQRKTVVRKAKSGYIVHCPVPPRPIILKTYLYMCAVTSFADAPSRRWRVRTTRERNLIKILNESGRSQ